MFDKESYVKKLIGHYLEDAPTLSGLPLEFLPVDIIPIRKGKYVRLDYTSSPELEKYINRIYKDVNKKELNAILEDETQDFTLDINNLIQYTYHLKFYNTIHLKTKEICAKFLENTIKNILMDLSEEDKNIFLDDYKLKDEYYQRGLKDYDYHLLNLDVTMDKFRETFKKKIIEVRNQFIEDNNIVKNELKAEGIKQTKMTLSDVMFNDIKNLNSLEPRIAKIVVKNSEYYTKEMKTSQYETVRIKNIGVVPIFRYVSLTHENISIYFTPFSSYILINNDVYTLYHIGRLTLEECEKQTIKAIQKFNLPVNCLENTKSLYLR